MKKYLAIILSLVCVLTGCQNTNKNSQGETTVDLSNQKALAAYFSYGENIKNEQNLSVDAVSSASLSSTDNENGNLQIMSQVIHDKTDADVFSIKVTEPYDDEYEVMRERAYEELDNESFPNLLQEVENMDNYNVIYIGTPVWSGNLPRPVATFLSENDLSDKTIIPFGIHLGSGFGTIIDEIKELCPNSTVIEGFTINASTSNDEVKDEFGKWLDEILED